MKPLIWILCVVLSISTFVEGSWDSPGTGQYHIQTDEGPERYFRYQTDNGQFRKEKRLKDGTVIGTEAWIDAAGYLRQKDYIADTKGYRILKSKTIFVGQGRPIEEALKSAKTAPAQSGVLVPGSIVPNSIAHSTQQKHDAGYVYSTTPIPPTPTRPAPSISQSTTPTPPPRTFGYLSPAEAAKLEPSPYLGYDHYPDELPHETRPAQPLVHIRPHSEPIEDYHDNDVHTSPPRLLPSVPSLSMEPPFPSNYRRLRPIAVVSSTTAPITAFEASPTAATLLTNDYPSPAPFGSVTGGGYYYRRQPTSDGDEHDGASHTRDDDSDSAVGVYASTTRPSPASLPLDINSLGVLQPPHPPTHYRRPRPQPPQLQSNTLDSDFQPAQDGDFDGVAVTRNGFRYFLPHQYHEEEQVDDEKRAGSFGYVDPFGIRRVIYYNASPEKGFVHRKNNRYVGFNAAPYDPPYNSRPY